MRVIVRRERPHPGAQLSLFEQRDGWRYEAFVTNTTAGQLAFLEARHRAHARVEDRIRHTKDSGLGRFPSLEFNINQTWLMITQIAADLTARTRLLGCVGDAATLATCEPKAVRYRFPPRARPTRSQRTPTSPQDPGVMALGNRDRRGLREHRRHPATGPSAPDITTRKTAARQRQPARRHTRNHSAHGRTRPHGSDTIPTAVMKDRGYRHPLGRPARAGRRSYPAPSHCRDRP
ncbi:hypothetical protein GCM10009859_00440 [Kocuria salsicia]